LIASLPKYVLLSVRRPFAEYTYTRQLKDTL
jgi:hypothetical protein